MLGILPTHPCSSIYASDTSRWPPRTPMPGVRQCITHSYTGHCMCSPAHTHHRFLEPSTLAGPCTLALCFAFIPPLPPSKSLRVESVFSTEPSTQVYMRAPRRMHTIHLPGQSMPTAVDMADALIFPSYILASARLCSRPPESTLRVPRRVCAT
jgi:hypothetical protein